MVVSFTCGSAAIMYWYVFTETAEGNWKVSWKPSDSLQEIRSGRLKVSTENTSDLVLTQPTYLDNDADCCPTGGSTDYVLRWRGDQFVAIAKAVHPSLDCSKSSIHSEFEMFSNPYKTTGQCYQMLAHVVQWLGPNAALMSIDFSDTSSASVLVDFPNSPSKRILQMLVVGEGAYNYTNTLGALMTVPRVRVVKITAQGAF
jgi:hypothetical protein